MWKQTVLISLQAVAKYPVTAQKMKFSIIIVRKNVSPPLFQNHSPITRILSFLKILYHPAHLTGRAVILSCPY